MNAPARIVSNEPGYDGDGYGWALHQAALMKARRFAEVDWENVIEEIESMGRSEYDSVESALRVALIHILKWDYQLMLRSRSWRASIATQLRNFDRRLRKNPGLNSHLGQILDDAYNDARVDATEETGLAMNVFPLKPPSWEDIRAPREL